MDDAERQLETFIDRFSPDVAATGREAIRRLRARLPSAQLLVYDNYNALAVGFAPSQRASEGILSIAFYPRWVSLFFLQGRALDDPDNLLKGNGNVERHIVLKAAADLDDPAISTLIDQALVKAKVPLDPGAAGTLTIKSIAPKQRARRP